MNTGRSAAGLLFAAGDYAAIVLAEAAALSLRNWVMDGTAFHVSAVYHYFLVPLLFMAFIFVQKLYEKKILFWQLAERIFYACLYGFLFSILFMYAANVAGQVSRLYVGLFILFCFPLLLAFRWIIGRLLIKARLFQTPVLIIGAGLSADAVVREIQKDTGMEYDIIGFLEDGEPKTDRLRGYPILGGFDDLEKVVKETGVRSILIAAPGLPQEELTSLIYRAQTVCEDVGIVPNLIAVPMSNITVETFFDEKIMVLHVKNNLAKASNRLIKRAFDLSLTIPGILILSPAFLWIAWKIRKDSEGPAIYKSPRIGKDGKPFICYKFRSMYMNSDTILQKYLDSHPKEKAEWDQYLKLKHEDPRVTPAGAFLRRNSLDEIPQLFNVLKGEMSLVGPRPILPKEMERYGVSIKNYNSVLPGITGLWQTSGRSDVDFEGRVRMDDWYIHNWSVWIDIVLLWRTVAVVLAHKGAY